MRAQHWSNHAQTTGVCQEVPIMSLWGDLAPPTPLVPPPAARLRRLTAKRRDYGSCFPPSSVKGPFCAARPPLRRWPRCFGEGGVGVGGGRDEREGAAGGQRSQKPWRLRVKWWPFLCSALAFVQVAEREAGRARPRARGRPPPTPPPRAVASNQGSRLSHARTHTGARRPPVRASRLRCLKLQRGIRGSHNRA